MNPTGVMTSEYVLKNTEGLPSLLLLEGQYFHALPSLKSGDGCQPKKPCHLDPLLDHLPRQMGEMARWSSKARAVWYIKSEKGKLVSLVQQG